MYSESEDIRGRSMIPMQDTPAHRFTYDARVQVPKGFDVRMSANRTKAVLGNNTSTFSFENTIKIPSYLIAIAVGDMTYKKLDERSGVIAESCMIDAAAKELEDIPKFVSMTE